MVRATPHFAAKAVFCIASSAMLIGLAGCGGGTETASVSGLVTMDDKPLADAVVSFIPRGGSGTPLFGRSDSTGHYDLSGNTQSGKVEVGKYTVRVTTFSEGNSDIDPPIAMIPERVPKKYNVDSDMTKEVAAGVNQIDLKLDSSGEIAQPKTW